MCNLTTRNFSANEVLMDYSLVFWALFEFYYSVFALPLLNILAKPVQGVNVIYAMPTEQCLGFHAVSVKIENMQTEFG